MAIARTHKSITDAAIKADEELKVLLNATEEEATPEVTPAATAVIEEKVIENAGAETDANKKVAAKVEPEVKPIEEKKEVANSENAIWHERYKEINGKYLNEVPRLAADKRELKKDIARLEEQVRVLTEQMVAKDNNGKEPHSQDAGINKLLDTFGEAGAQEIGAYLDERVKEIERKFESKLKPVETGIETIKTGQAVTARQRYTEGLDNLVPNWRQYDRDPAFNKWLDNNFLQYTGQSFGQILTEADANMNVPVIAKIILDYEKNITPQKNISDDTRQKELEKQLTPAKAGGSGRIPKGNEVETYSKKVIDKFYQDWQSQKLKMSIPDRMKMDEVYTRAIIEGRLTP